LIRIDVPRGQVTKDQQAILSSIPPNRNRAFSYCDRRHNNYGHTCRHQIWEQAKGDYILYIDDDDYIADKEVLNTLDSVTEPWAIFPVLRYGEVFFNMPPGIYRTGTGMFIHRKEIGRWPDSNSYDADGEFVEQLRAKYPYQILDSRPMIILPKTSYGVWDVDSWSGDKLAKLIFRWRQCSDFVKARMSR
jgi:glycosyltransferase involved in cell wall biosynthesis